MKPSTLLRLAIWVSIASSNPLMAQPEPDVTRCLETLKVGSDLDAQLDSLQSIATSLDPRIPPACLPLLKSPGDSIRRNAARAIGSRWHQIADGERATYVRALKATLDVGDPDLSNMVRRGIGLVTRTYAGDMFSRSRSKRWVVYERHHKPCIIDTRTGTEELLWDGTDIFFLPALGNAPLTGSCLWHPKLDMVALQMVLFRRPLEVWVWRHPGGLRRIPGQELFDLLKPAQGRILPNSPYSSEFASWKGDSLDLTVLYTVLNNDVYTEHSAQVRWDPHADSLRVVADRVVD